MSQGGLNSLATIIKRLEAATSRLEDIALASTAGLTPQDVTNVPPPPPPPPPPAPSASSNETPRSVETFDETVIQQTLKPFVEFSKSFVGPLVIDQVNTLDKEFANVRSIILLASACTKPDTDSFNEILKPLQAGIENMERIKNSKRSEWDNHLSMIAEGSKAVGWVAVAPKPGPFIGEMKDSAQFYGNRVIKEFKEKDPKHVEWVRGYIAVLETLRKYVTEFHTTGLVWNSKGVPVSEYKPPSVGSAPPPPPPPPPPLPAPNVSSPPGIASPAAVFAELNRGEEVTKGLRKVDKSQMTHKNPALRAGGSVPTSTGPSIKKPMKPSKPPSLAGKKPPKFFLEGNRKWVIEHYENDSNLVVENAELSHTVNLFNCKNITVQVKGKVNAVTLANCAKTSILVDSVISGISITSSPSFALQIMGTAPTVQLDSTDSGQIYLSRNCLDVEITTAKCSNINVSLPVEGEEDGVFVEKPVPEMLRTVIKDGRLVTSIVEHTG